MTRCSGGEPNRAEDGNVKLSWGESAERMLHISEVPSGLACGCRCPECHERLVARKGTKQAHNFAHYSTRECRAAYETMVHRVAKQIIADRKQVRTPKVVAVYGNAKKPLRDEVDFRLDEVALEQWITDMRPDIVARRRTRSGEIRELLVEIKVTHPCGPDKTARIRDRRLAAIEIDLSKVPRNASPEELKEAILFSAPREWLFNAVAEEVVDEMRADAERRAARERRREEERRRRVEAKLKRDTAQITAIFRKASAAERKPTERGRQHIGRIRDARLEKHVGHEIVGNVWFSVPGAEWQAALVDRFAIGAEHWYIPGFTSEKALDFLRSLRFVWPDSPLDVSKHLCSATRAEVPDFRSPSEVVEAYLHHLQEAGLLRKQAGEWFRNEGMSRIALDAIREASEQRDREAEFAAKLRELLDAVPGGRDVDVERWSRTVHQGITDTPAAVVEEGGPAYRKLLQHLDRLKAMLNLGAAVEENLLGLPLEEQLRVRQDERRRAEEERARQAAEAARKAAEAERKAADEAQLAAKRRKETIARRAIELLGKEDGEAWLTSRSSLLGGVQFDQLNGLTEMQDNTLWGNLSGVHRLKVRKEEEEVTKLEAQEALLEEAASYKDREWATSWMRLQNDLLDGRRPDEVCIDQAGLARCREALWQTLMPTRRRSVGKRRSRLLSSRLA